MSNENDSMCEVEEVTCIKLTSGTSTCIISQEAWDKSCKVLDVIFAYTRGVDVRKIAVIQAVQTAAHCQFPEARVITEVYFSSKFKGNDHMCWYDYTM